MKKENSLLSRISSMGFDDLVMTAGVIREELGKFKTEQAIIKKDVERLNTASTYTEESKLTDTFFKPKIESKGNV